MNSFFREVRDWAASPDVPMLVRDARPGGFIRVNRCFEQTVGYTAAELQAQRLEDLIDPADQPAFRDAVAREAGCVTARLRTRDGDWIEFDWKTRTAESGASLFGALHRSGCAPDVADDDSRPTPSVDMRAILKEMALIIEDQHEGLKCSILLLDEAGERVSVGAGPSLPQEYNAAVEGLMIGPHVGSCGTAAYWNERVLVEDIQNDVLWQDLKGYAAKAGVAACWSAPVTAKNGAVLGATALYSPVPRAPTQQELDGLAMAARMFALAIEHSRAEQALKDHEAERLRREAELEEQLRQTAKMEALGVMAGGVAHDFNNLLTTVMGNAEIVMDSVPEGSDAHDALLDITSASARASALCNQMLAFAGRSALITERIDCNRAIRELGELLKISIPKKAILDYRLCRDPLYVEADKAQLDQVIMNLITNAAESLEGQSGNVLAATGVRRFEEDDLIHFQPRNSLAAGSYAWFSISDTGSGIPSEIQERIFDPFFTTKFTGRGLGLAAVSGIVQQHRGGIRLQSEMGKGTTFTLVFPPAEPPDGVATSGERAAKRVLIVDDESEVRKTLQRVLTADGFEVLLTRDGPEAIERFKAEHETIDCVLLDFSMPELDGEETYRELRKIRPDVRVILNSGYAEQEYLTRFAGLELAGVLKKPSPRAVIVATVRAAIGPL